MSDVVLLAWLLVDVLWTGFLFVGTSYLVFWRGHSGWWLVAAIICGPLMGGAKLYRALAKRLGVEEGDPHV